MSQSKHTSHLSSERVEISLQMSPRKGESKTVELPLNILVIGNFQGITDDLPIDERTPVNIDKSRFNVVMQAVAPRLQATVDNHMVSTPKGEKLPDLALDIDIHSIDDFHPDNLVRQVPQLNRLFKLRELLIDLRHAPEKSQQILEQIAELAMASASNKDQ